MAAFHSYLFQDRDRTGMFFATANLCNNCLGNRNSKICFKNVFPLLRTCTRGIISGAQARKRLERAPQVYVCKCDTFYSQDSFLLLSYNFQHPPDSGVAGQWRAARWMLYNAARLLTPTPQRTAMSVTPFPLNRLLNLWLLSAANACPCGSENQLVLL
ncbi:hypothetical protein XELAEV_18002879mg [Xenopus laevis]|nr:hypothetical protein XELAEV_18002879mg [Xenopus laevis]